VYFITIDFGNTLTKLGIFQNNDLIEVKPFDSNNLIISDFEKILSEYKPQKIAYSSVINLSDELITFFKEKQAIELTYKSKLPFKNNYDSIETLGIDRIAGVLGAYSLFPGEHLLVVQSGTCVTYDFFDKEKGYLGGAISPGKVMRFKALHTFTKKLPFIKTQKKMNDVVGSSTQTSIASGVFNGINFEFNGFIDYFLRNFERGKIILSGGDVESRFIGIKEKNKIFAIQNITLFGLKKNIELNETSITKKKHPCWIKIKSNGGMIII